ncbi:FGGY family carbohydrate kinase [Streptomyces sp. NPDC002851]
MDTSTQSCKVMACDADTGEVLDRGRAAHPEGTEAPPQAWWEALCAVGEGLLDQVDAVAVAGQPDGLVALDVKGRPVRDALLWNDTGSARSAADLITELGGANAWAEAAGTVPLAAVTAAKLRWLADHEPHHADRTATVLLPHDYLTWRLRGGIEVVAETFTDQGDASGTAYWSPAEGRYREDLLSLALCGRTPRLPRILGPSEPAGLTPGGALVAAGTSDNADAALGLGIEPGDVVISLGTSGTAFASAPHPSADPSGAVAGFADATGRFLPLVCTLNAARVLSSTARMLGTDLTAIDTIARQSTPGAEGLARLPYLGGERTPNLPDAAGSLHGRRKTNMYPHHIARAAVEGMLCSMADALDRLRDQGVAVRRVQPTQGHAAALTCGGVHTVPAQYTPRTHGGCGVYVTGDAGGKPLGHAEDTRALTGRHATRRSLPDVERPAWSASRRAQ